MSDNVFVSRLRICSLVLDEVFLIASFMHIVFRTRFVCLGLVCSLQTCFEF